MGVKLPRMGCGSYFWVSCLDIYVHFTIETVSPRSRLTRNCVTQHKAFMTNANDNCYSEIESQENCTLCLSFNCRGRIDSPAPAIKLLNIFDFARFRDPCKLPCQSWSLHEFSKLLSNN